MQTLQDTGLVTDSCMLHLSMSQLQKAHQGAETDHCQGQGIKAFCMAEAHLSTAGVGTRETHGIGAWETARTEL